MRKSFLLLIALVLIGYLAERGIACDYCISSQGISPVELGSTGIRYDLRYLHLGDIFHDGHRVENPLGAEETFITHQFSFHYRLGDALTFSLLLPFSSRSALITGPPEGDVHGIKGGQQPQHIETRSDKATGLGDMIVLAKYRVLDENSSDNDPLTFVVSGGVKLPTGKSDLKTSSGLLLDDHIQLGSGSTDLIAGFSVLKGIEDFSLVAAFMGILPTEGANGYKYGANLNYDLGIRYRFLDGEGVSGSLFGALSILGEVRGKESRDGVKLDDTGGNTTYLAPGAVYFLTSRISVEASYQYPILHNLNGMQLGESYRFTAGAQYLF
jgi:hypothetical protein